MGVKSRQRSRAEGQRDRKQCRKLAEFRVGV